MNAQSLTAREIALRLNPDRFASTLFLPWKKEPDLRLLRQAKIRFVRIPPRFGSLVIARELLWGQQDILFYPSINERASRLFWQFRGWGRPKRIIENVECSLAQIQAESERAIKFTLQNIRGSDRCFAITPAISASFDQEYGLETEVIPLGVNLNLFMPMDRTDRTAPVRVLCVASIQPRKQPHLIVKLAKLMRTEPVEFHLIGPVIGDASYKGQLLMEKEQNGLDNVTFHGPMSQEEISQWMRQSDVFVLPSRLEGFGKVTIEAGATGLPAIIFSDYQSTTVVDGVTGFQVKTFEEMHDRLQLLVKNRELRLRMGAAAVEHVKQFSWDVIAIKWETVFAELVS